MLDQGWMQDLILGHGWMQGLMMGQGNADEKTVIPAADLFACMAP